MGKHCVYGLCASDSRYTDSIKFACFPKPHMDKLRAKRWVHLIGRKQFTIENITKDTYVCSLHFPPGINLDWKKNPDLEPFSYKINGASFQMDESKRSMRYLRRTQPLQLEDSPEYSDDVQNFGSINPFLRKLAVTEEEVKCLQSGEDVQNFENINPNLGKSAIIEDEDKCLQSGDDNFQTNENEKPTQYHHTYSKKQPKITHPKILLLPLQQSTDSSISVGIDMGEPVKKKFKNKLVQTAASCDQEVQDLKKKVISLQKNLLKLKENHLNEFCQDVMENDDKMNYYTGLTVEEFNIVWRFLGPAKDRLRIWEQKSTSTSAQPMFCPGKQKANKSSRISKISPMNQLIITLVQMRQGYTLTDLSYRFKYSRTFFSKLFTTWVQFLYLRFKGLEPFMYPPREDHKPLPRAFNNPMLRDTRIVFDCTEFLTETSLNFKQQGNLYSAYKSHCTAKALIGVSPHGSCMFVSDVWEGSVSDRRLTIESGALDNLHPGDVVLADRGFTIQDLVEKKGARLVIPPFTNKRKQFSIQEIYETKLIAKARVHIERFNEKIKNFRILQGKIPQTNFPMLSQIVFVICCLVNMKKPLLNK